MLRYDKHFVTCPGQTDYQRLATLDLQQVLATAKAGPHVDGSRIFLCGWSEESVVGAALAVRRPEIADLILQGPVAVPWRQIFLRQFRAAGVPYLHSFAPDGLVSAATLHDAGATGRHHRLAQPAHDAGSPCRPLRFSLDDWTA